MCPGDSNQRCCLNCNPSCQADEEYFLQFDGPCTSSGGACLVNSNYCAGYYSSGKCGGYNNRQCCSTGEPGGGSGGNPTNPPPTEPPAGGTGEYFWNSYTGYTLDGSASSTLYSRQGSTKSNYLLTERGSVQRSLCSVFQQLKMHVLIWVIHVVELLFMLVNTI